MKDTTIYFIRHGEVYNPDRVIYGNVVDVPLSQKGFDQIEILGKRLKNKGIVPDIIFSSPLKRAKQSAQMFQKVYGKTQWVVDSDLRDAGHAELKGLTIEWLKSIGGDIYSYKGDELKGLKFESPQEQAKRIISVIDRIRNQYPDKTVFVIGHGDPTAFAIWKLLHPGLELPSIIEIAKNSYLKKGEAWKFVFDEDGNIVENELIQREDTLVKGEREY